MIIINELNEEEYNFLGVYLKKESDYNEFVKIFKLTNINILKVIIKCIKSKNNNLLNSFYRLLSNENKLQLVDEIFNDHLEEKITFEYFIELNNNIFIKDLIKSTKDKFINYLYKDSKISSSVINIFSSQNVLNYLHIIELLSYEDILMNLSKFNLYNILYTYQQNKKQFIDFEKISNICEMLLSIILFNKDKKYKISLIDVKNIIILIHTFFLALFF